MNTFHLTVSAIDGKLFDGDVTSLFLRGADGDLAVLPGHSAFTTSVQPCTCRAVADGTAEQTWDCSGGILSVSGNEAVLIIRLAVDD